MNKLLLACGAAGIGSYGFYNGRYRDLPNQQLSKDEAITILKEVRKGLYSEYTIIAWKALDVKESDNSLSEAQIKEIISATPYFSNRVNFWEDKIYSHYSTSKDAVIHASEDLYKDEPEVQKLKSSIHEGLENAYKGIIPPLIGGIPSFLDSNKTLGIIQDSFDEILLATYEDIEKINEGNRKNQNMLEFELELGRIEDARFKVYEKYGLIEQEDSPWLIAEAATEHYLKNDPEFVAQFLASRENFEKQLIRIKNGNFTKTEADKLRDKLANISIF